MNFNIMYRIAVFLLIVLISLPVLSMKTVEVEVDSLAFGNNVMIDSMLSEVTGVLEKYNRIDSQCVLTVAMTDGEDCKFLHITYEEKLRLTDKVKYEGFLMFKGFMVLIVQKEILSIFNLAKTSLKRKMRLRKPSKCGTVEVYDPLNWIYILHGNEFYLVHGFPYKPL